MRGIDAELQSMANSGVIVSSDAQSMYKPADQRGSRDEDKKSPSHPAAAEAAAGRVLEPRLRTGCRLSWSLGSGLTGSNHLAERQRT